MNKRTLEDLEVEGKVVLLRADFNIPIPDSGPEALGGRDHRLRAALPTIRRLLDRNCKILLCSHLGRPKGRVVEALRMAPIAARLAGILSRPVEALDDCIGPGVEGRVSRMRPGDILMLENLRFHPGEEANDPEFAKALASLAGVFVLDAFGAAHRAHASIVGPPQHLPSAMGLLLQREVEAIGGALESPQRPLATVLGGAKVSDKIKLIENLVARADLLLIGGGMGAAFLKAQGVSVGASPVEEDQLDRAAGLLAAARGKNTPIHLPVDVVVSSEFSRDPSKVQCAPVDRIPEGCQIMDIGPRTVEEFSDRLSRCGTVIWNGPVGVFEYPRFSAGTKGVAEALASLDATTIIGGGSTAEAVASLGLSHRMTHVSSGGGAMIEFMEGKDLPGIAALPRKQNALAHSQEKIY